MHTRGVTEYIHRPRIEEKGAQQLDLVWRYDYSGMDLIVVDVWLIAVDKRGGHTIRVGEAPITNSTWKPRPFERYGVLVEEMHND